MLVAVAVITAYSTYRRLLSVSWPKMVVMVTYTNKQLPISVLLRATCD